MLVVTLPVRAAAIVVVAAAASAPPPASFAPPLELPEPPDPPELLAPLELPEPLEPPDGEPESGWGDEELLPQAKSSEEEIDATARELRTKE
jgi:hypothetical protein